MHTCVRECVCAHVCECVLSLFYFCLSVRLHVFRQAPASTWVVVWSLCFPMVFSSASFLDDLIEFHGFPKQLYAEHSQIKFQPILFYLSSIFSVTLQCPRNALLLIIFKRKLNGNPSHNNFSTSVNAFTTQSAAQVKKI